MLAREGHVGQVRRVWQTYRANPLRFFVAATCFVTAIVIARPALPAPPALPALPALQAPAPPPRKARLFPPLDLGLLEAPDRDLWQKPEQIMDALKIAEGSVVAEIGAAGGWFTIHLARRVGPNGRVYAEDIQPQMVDAISRRVQRENLQNVVTVLGRPADPRLPPGIDAALIVETFHEMEDPVALLKNLTQALKPQGLVGIVDYNAGAGGPGPGPDERVDPESEIRAAAVAGLRLVKKEEVPPFQFMLIFEKAAEAPAHPGL
jgi:SAM-dependent methyltransferase